MNQTSTNQPATRRPRRKLDDRLITGEHIPDYVIEIFSSLRTKISLALQQCDEKSIVVTSLDMDAGKSTVAANMAISFAKQGLPTILIDGDMRRGVLHNTFVVNKSSGLSDFLFSEKQISEETVFELFQQTHVPNLYLVSSGHNLPNPIDLLTSERFVAVKQILNRHFGMIIFDSPPLGAATDAVTVVDLFSRYVLVAKAGATNIIDLNKKIDEFPILKNKIIGIVLNQAHVGKKLKYYKYSRYSQ
ncbi:MAG: polysaccharide biosynthesis tyrosine autokinase [Chitinivibrionales bacterium]|nr:polysaccharide biosynthesis tyrosine autokinase [Chitinivibrionales bacterium]